MSEIKVNKISPRTNCGTVQLGDSGDTITIPAGATITNSGTAAGFGSTGEVSWNTTKVTTGFTAASGIGYFADTSSGGFTITLPATPSAGNVIAISDYTGTFSTGNLTIGRNSSNINGAAADIVLAKNNITVQLIYVDATEGWRIVFTGSQTGDGLFENFVCASGGTITESGNCKIHTFTGPGTFTVNSVACTAANNVVSYMVVAGGGAGGIGDGGGGGAGGFREYKSPVTPYTASPLNGNPGGTAVTVTAQAYPITVGAGGTVGNGPAVGGNGNNSIFSTITSTAGGGSPNNTSPPFNGNPGGSGGGGGGKQPPAGTTTGGSGNTPPTTPSQGSNGGNGEFVCGSHNSGGGGGGATAVGTNAGPNPSKDPTSGGFAGGAGATSHITGSPVTYSAGGTGDFPTNPVGPYNENISRANGGGGGTGLCNGGAPSVAGNQGGSGIVVIRYKFQ